MFETLFADWKVLTGGGRTGTIPSRMWRMIALSLSAGMRTLEFGSGLSTWLFDRSGCEHLALESDSKWKGFVDEGIRGNTRVLLCGLSPFYDWSHDGEPFDVVLIDGPKGEGTRCGVMGLIDSVAHARTLICVDDCHRRSESELAHRLSVHTGKPLTVFRQHNRKFGMLR